MAIIEDLLVGIRGEVRRREAAKGVPPASGRASPRARDGLRP